MLGNLTPFHLNVLDLGRWLKPLDLLYCNIRDIPIQLNM